MSNQKILRILFWLVLGTVLALSIMPPDDAPAVFANDKLNHILAFFVLSSAARILWSRVNGIILFSMLTAFGGAIELLQFAMAFGRDADWMDFAVDVIAIVLGFLTAQALNTIRNQTSIKQ
ncbi:MAG: hypothetical protein WBM39_02235 [Parasphingorhabdus sp.]